MIQTTTIYNPIPTRISSTHYQMPSRTREGKMHDLKLVTNKQGKKMWKCFCEDAAMNKNLDCDHRIYLIEWIQQEKAKQAPASERKQHSSSVELVNVLSRIANLEVESANLRDTMYAQNELIDIKDQQITNLQDRLRASEMREPIQQKQIDHQGELIGSLQTSVCRLNERTINQDVQIQQLIAAMEQQRRTIDDQTQQIDKLHEAVSSQQKTSEQVVRIVVEQPVRERKAKEAPEATTAKRGRKPNLNNFDDIEEAISFMSVLQK